MNNKIKFSVGDLIIAKGNFPYSYSYGDGENSDYLDDSYKIIEEINSLSGSFTFFKNEVYVISKIQDIQNKNNKVGYYKKITLMLISCENEKDKAMDFITTDGFLSALIDKCSGYLVDYHPRVNPT